MESYQNLIAGAKDAIAARTLRTSTWLSSRRALLSKYSLLSWSALCPWLPILLIYSSMLLSPLLPGTPQLPLLQLSEGAESTPTEAGTAVLCVGCCLKTAATRGIISPTKVPSRSLAACLWRNSSSYARQRSATSSHEFMTHLLYYIEYKSP